MSLVWGQQIEHPCVVAAWLAGKRPRNQIRQVGVADADGVGIAEGGAGRFRCCPRPDAGDLLQA